MDRLKPSKTLVAAEVEAPSWGGDPRRLHVCAQTVSDVAQELIGLEYNSILRVFTCTATDSRPLADAIVKAKKRRNKTLETIRALKGDENYNDRLIMSAEADTAELIEHFVKGGADSNRFATRYKELHAELALRRARKQEILAQILKLEAR